ncbi:hypothetical protein Tco_1232974 [Tanacetum coccineum]
MNQVVSQGTPVARNANNKRKWGIDHGENSERQQNKRCKVGRAHTAGPGNKKGYAGTLPNYIKCMDWLSKYRTVNGCNEKLVRIPLGDETINDSGQ